MSSSAAPLPSTLTTPGCALARAATIFVLPRRRTAGERALLVRAHQQGVARTATPNEAAAARRLAAAGLATAVACTPSGRTLEVRLTEAGTAVAEAPPAVRPVGTVFDERSGGTRCFPRVSNW